jgi:tetratricopeptide (TPR) repeat protein
MLYTKNHPKTIFSSLIALLIFLPCSFFLSSAHAATKEQIAEEYRSLGYAEHQKGNLNAALNYYTKAISLGLEKAEVLNDVGILYEQVDFPNRAEYYYLKAISVDQTYLPAYMNLAYLYKSRGQKEKAVIYFRKRLEMGSLGDPWTDKATEELLALRPDYHDWAMSVKSAWLKDEVVKLRQEEFYNRVKASQEYLKKGEDLKREGKLKEAMEAFNSALTLAPDNPQIMEARRKVSFELAKESIQLHSDQAIRMLDAGDALSAQQEIQEMLTRISENSNTRSK